MIGFERQHMRLNESARTLAQILDFGWKSEVHAGAPQLIFIKAGIVASRKGYIEAKGGGKSEVKAMKRIILAIGGAAVLLCLGMPPSHAGYGDAPWCAVINVGTGEMYWDCQYQTFDACVPNVIAGNRGFCNVNPTYKPVATAPARRSVRHHPPKHS